MALELIATKILTNLVDIGTKILGERVTEYNKRLAQRKEKKDELTIDGRLVAPIQDLQNSIQYHLEHVQSWSSSMKFTDIHEAKSISQIYVDLDTYLIPIRKHLSLIERKQKKALIPSVATSRGHVVILGQVGAGKTTSIKRLCASFFTHNESRMLTQKFPILIRLRELPAKPIWPTLPILSAIHQIIALNVSVRPSNSKHQIPREWTDDTIVSIWVSALEELAPIIVLDGFDEVSSATLRIELMEEFSMLCQKLKNAKLILTSRVGEFNREIFNTDTFEIAPLSREQVIEFSQKWHTDQGKSSHFINEIDKSPYAGAALKPLTLAHLCAIYERLGEVPDKPKTVYRKIVGLLIEEWDQQRGIQRISKYSRFSGDRKFDFLSHLAYNLTAQRKQTVFTSDDLAKAYFAICTHFGLPTEDAEDVANELESHTGLFIEASYRGYEFVHKSIQEYLTAEHIVRLPYLSIPASQFPGLAAELAIATAVSSNPGIYYCMLMQKSLDTTEFKDFFPPYAARLLQERPDFQECPEAFAYALKTILQVGESDLTMALANRILRVTSMNAIGFYYQAHDIKGRPYSLKQIRPHEILQLPLELQFERGLLERIKRLALPVTN